MQTQSAISAWFRKYLTSLPVLLPLVALVIGYWWPGVQSELQAVAQNVGFHEFLNLRAGSSVFFAAAYLYWWTLVLMLPVSLVWMHRLAKKLKLHEALCVTARSNLLAKTWDPKKWTLKNGRFRFGAAVVLAIVLALTGLLVAKEPSFCQGCETASLIGFILVNWLAIHAMLIYGYVMCVYFYFWKIVRSNIGEGNE